MNQGDGSIPIGAPLPPQQVIKWAEELQAQIAISKEVFQERHNAVYDSSKELSDKTTAGPIQALNICMQIEKEFPGKIEEFLERAGKSRYGMLWGLILMVRAYRERA